MKWGFTFLLFLALLAPIRVSAQESLHTPRLDASFNNNGSWDLTDTLVGISWHGQWLSDTLMKVSGSDNTCFILTENEHGMVQLDCENLTGISILISAS